MGHPVSTTRPYSAPRATQCALCQERIRKGERMAVTKIPDGSYAHHPLDAAERCIKPVRDPRPARPGWPKGA
jgi:hypothetical protein